MNRVATNTDAQVYIEVLLNRLKHHGAEWQDFSAGLQDRIEEESLHIAEHLPTFGYTPFGDMDSWLN